MYAYIPSKNAKGIHLITMNTPNGQAVQILLEELKDTYGTEWTTTLVDIMTNDQKKDWFLKLNPNGKLRSHPLSSVHNICQNR
jgi:glutathione S-transferase